MRRLLLIVPLLAAMAVPSAAQDRSDRIGLGVGMSYHPAAYAVLFWEHETRYHNAWEVSVEGQLLLPESSSPETRLWDNGWRWGVGAAYKPCVYRARNRYGSARFGVSLGAAPSEFQAALQAGWQQSYALRGGWQFYWQAGASVTLPKWGGLFHAGGAVGFKIPVRDHFHNRSK